MRKLYFTAVLLLCTFLSYSQTQWIGPAGGDWSTAANWTNGVPSAGNDALITGGSDIAINNPIIIDFGVTNFSGDIAVNADVFNIGNFINSGGNMSLDNGALFLNSGAVTFTNDGPFSNDGTFLNYGTFQQNGNGVFDNNPTGVFINFGNITNVGNFNNNGTVENFGALTNASTFVNNALTRNCGQFINTFVSTLDNTAGATFHNKAGAQLFIDKDFNNAGTLDDDGSTTVNASGVVNNTGTININGLFRLSTIFNNDGIVNVDGTYTSNFGTTNNNSTWNNTGSTQNLGTFNNNAGSTLANTGTLMNASCANFYQRSNGTINALTNDGVLYELNGTVNTTGASQGVALQNANAQPTPVLICRDIQIQTDANGEVSITAGDVLVDGDAKYCNIVTLEVTQTDFTCADLGVNPVTVTLTDGFNNSNTCTVDVTIVETSPNPCNSSFLNYCAATSNLTTNEYIQSVSIADLTNTSNNSLKTDFTNQVAMLEFGDFYDLEVITGGANGTVTTAAYIDWNNDGDFDDADEEVLYSLDGATTVSSVVNVPGTALPGKTRMRVIIRRGGDINACSNVTFGEVEDYTIMIASDIIIQNCVGDIVVSAPAGATEQIVGWIPPKGFSTCQNSVDIELVSGLPAGSAFPIGTTTNTLRFFDGCGGELECSFDVTVNPTPVTFSLACRDDVILEASAGLGGAIANWLAPFPTASCPAGVNLPTQTVGPAPGDFLPIGTRATVCYEATDNCGNTDNCCFEVFVTDPAESLDFNNCPSVITVDGTPGAAGTVVNYPTFTATSSCAAGGLNIVLQNGLPSGSIFPNGNTTITYRATDDCNSAALCSFVVTVNPTPSEVIVNCPDDIVVDVNPGAPSQVVNYPAVTATSNCPGAVTLTQTQGLPSGNAFPLGNTVVQYMVNDACGDMENCTFNVTLNTQGATTTLNCPNDLTVNADPGDVGAVVTWTTPTATSDCFTGNANVTLVSALSSGDQFPLGTQEVIYFASDDCGTSDGCSFLVTVEPTQANLTLGCRNDITRTMNVGGTNPTVSWSGPTNSTTCGGIVTVTQIAGPAPGSAFAPGSTTITYRGTDNCGNVELCSFDIIVNVNTPADDPEITIECLEDITLTAAPGQTVASVGFDVPTATTTCNGGGGGGGGGVGNGLIDCSQIANTISGYSYLGEFENSKYFMSNSTMSFATAKNAAESLGGNIVTIGSQAENDFITSVISSSGYIGFTDESSEGNFTWVSGEPVNYTNWSANEPNNSNNEDFTQIRTNGSWNDIRATTHQRSIIEIGCPAQSCANISDNISGYTFIGEFEGSKYYVANGAQSWESSRDAAIAAGGHLAVVTSQAENDFINNNGTASSGSFWLGLQNVNQTTTFQWVNGEPVSYTNWNTGEPNETHENVFARMIDGSGKWTDRTENLRYNGVLEIECGSGFNATCQANGRLKREVWNDLAANRYISSIPLNTTPDLTDIITSFETPFNIGDRYGTRVSGWVIAPQTGNYTFWISSDNNGELWLSTDENPNNTSLIASLDGNSNRNEWDRFPSQQSVQISLVAGTSYYIEALLKENSGGDHLGVGWQLPDGTLNRPITAEYISDVPCTVGTGSGGTSEATVTQVHGLAPNTNFPVGTTTVIYEVTDDCGNTAYCEFDVTVNQPNSAIALNNCPTDITVTAAAGATSAIANFTAPTATSDCTQGNVVVSQIGGFASGQAFPVGQTTVSYRAVDGCGNEQFCSFFVIVEATDPPATEITVNCPTNIMIDAAAGANSASATFSTPTATTTCNGNVNITQIGGLPSGSDFPIGTTVIFYRLADECGNIESCAFNIMVSETPSSIDITCPANVSVDAAPDAAFAAATFSQATATSDCFTGTESIVQIGGLPSGSLFPVGNSVVFFKASDACGNFAVCNFLVTVNATPITTLDCVNNGGDADGDGVCADEDCDDNNPLVSQPGDACNDGDANTKYDAYDTNCNCVGVPLCTGVDDVNATVTSTNETAFQANDGTITYTYTDDALLGGTRTQLDFSIDGGVTWPYGASDASGSFTVSNLAPDTYDVWIRWGNGQCPEQLTIVTITAANQPFDCPALSANIGDACNDGNANTSNDVIQADCSCQGTINPPTFDCPALSANIGDACDDGNANTNNDTVQADCSCAGTVIPPTFDCPALSANIGDACDDGNANTNNDTVQADCSCAGTPVQTGCTATYTLNGLDIDFSNVDAPISTVKVFDNGFGTVFACDNFGGTACADNFTVTVPGAGTYFIQIQTYQDWATNLCDVFETVEIGGTPPVYDCPALSANIGDACNDGDSNTANDTVQADCSCAGTPVGSFDCPALSANIGDACDDGDANTNGDTVQADCSCAGTPVSTTCDVTYTINGLDITFNNLNAPITAVKVFTNSYQTVFSCDDWTTPCNPSEVVTVPSAGDYIIQVQTYQDWSTPLCDFSETVTIGGTSPTFDCPALSANIGDACNDNNGNTINDVVQADCSCEGTPVSPVLDCPNLNLNIGDSCDDGNPNTSNDTVQADCSCAGTPASTGCDVTYTINGLDITFNNLNAPISTAKVFDNSFATLFACDNFGGTVCSSIETVTVPGPGTYFVSYQTYQDWATPLCDEFVTVEITGDGGGTTPPTCDNVTNGGSITGDQTICSDVTPGTILNATLPSGGSGTVEYLWLSSTTSCPMSLSDEIVGATQSSMAPGLLSQTTYFRRLSRRVGCTDWFAGESNCVVVTVEDCNDGGNPPTGGCDATYTVSGMDITLNNIAANIAASAIFDNTFAPVFQCNNFGGTACNNTEVVTVPGPGNYFVQIQTYTDWSNQLCNIFEEVTVTGNANRQSNNDNTQISNPIRLDVNTTQSIADFKVFPNPAHDNVKVGLNEYLGQNVQIRLVNQLGVTLQNVSLTDIQEHTHQIDLSSIHNGIYTLTIFADGQKPVSKKLVVRRN